MAKISFPSWIVLERAIQILRRILVARVPQAREGSASCGPDCDILHCTHLWGRLFVDRSCTDGRGVEFLNRHVCRQRKRKKPRLGTQHKVAALSLARGGGAGSGTAAPCGGGGTVGSRIPWGVARDSRHATRLATDAVQCLCNAKSSSHARARFVSVCTAPSKWKRWRRRRHAIEKSDCELKLYNRGGGPLQLGLCGICRHHLR